VSGSFPEVKTIRNEEVMMILTIKTTIQPNLEQETDVRFYKRVSDTIQLEYLDSDPRSPGVDVPFLLSMPLRGRLRVTPEK
jgi:hypothetical protein